MAQQVINVGPAANDGLGDPIRTAFIKTNENFSELYSRAQSSPPATLIGSVGDEAGMYAYDSNYWYYCFANYDGVSVIWAQIAEIGNVAVTQIASGNTSVGIPASSGNVAFTVGGISNVVVVTNQELQVAGIVSASGNIAGQYFIGNGSQLTGIVTSAAPSGNLGGNLLGNGYGANNFTFVSSTGNITGGNIISSGNVSASGNVIGTYFIGNGSQLTGISTSSSSITNGLSSASIPATNGNVTVSVGIVGTIADFTTTGLLVTGLVSASGNVTGGNIKAGDRVSAAGNIIGQYFIGDGSQLTGIATTGSNITNGLSTVSIATSSGNVAVSVGVAGNIGVFTTSGLGVSGIVSASSNVTGANVLASGLVSAVGNIIGGNVDSLGDVSAAGNISVVGNVSGTYFIGNGSLLTGIMSGGSIYGNANVAAYLPTYTGNLSPGNVTVANNLVINGTTTAQGNINGNLTGTTTGIHNGLVFSIDIRDLSWDFGYIAANTYTNPIQYLLNNAGSIDMGTVTAPAALEIDIGTLL